MGRIEGREEPDRYVILGSHRDAWMFGAVDALSSQAGLVEVAKAFGKLRKEGRSITGALDGGGGGS